jgi:hypothetical protein
MVRAMGPIAPRIENGPTHGGRCPRPGIRPGVGLSEQMPVKCAGTRTDPPLSLPRPAADSSRRDGRRLAPARSARRAVKVPGIVRAPMEQDSRSHRPSETRGSWSCPESTLLPRAAAPPRRHLLRDLALVQQAADLASVARGRNRRLDGDRQVHAGRRAVLGRVEPPPAPAHAPRRSRQMRSVPDSAARSAGYAPRPAQHETFAACAASSSCRVAGASTSSFMAAFPAAIAASDLGGVMATTDS